MFDQSVQIDPLNSPHPVPWSWVLATLGTQPAKTTGGAVNPGRMHYYRSPSLLSPDRQFAAYSRIQMQVQSDFWRSCLSSVLFLENLATGNLQAVTAESPLAGNPFLEDACDRDGTISMVIPLSWSETGDRLLAREFESVFGSDVASDYAVIVDRTTTQVHTIAPVGMPYTNAILLGWSQFHPDQALFQAGTLGAEDWQLYTVDAASQTTPASGDQPVTFGAHTHNVWMGPQRQP